MARKSMRIYVALDVDYPDNPKIIAAGERAELLYIRANCLAKRMLSDGKVDLLQLPRMGLSGWKERATKLVDVGLWEEAEGGYRITGWLDRNDTADEIAARRQKKAEAGRKGGQRSGEVRRGEPHGEAGAS